MRYQKPDVVAVASALDAVQGGQKGPGPRDFPQDEPSIGAYEADE